MGQLGALRREQGVAGDLAAAAAALGLGLVARATEKLALALQI